MLRNHPFGKLLVVSVTVMLALPGVARARGDSTRYRVEKVGRGPEDDAQMRELLAKLAAASGEPAPEERTDADLMYEAMLRWNGEPAGSAAVDRLLESSKKAAASSKRATIAKVRHMFWKDPFADDPRRLIPVRQEDRVLLDAYDSRTPRKQWREPQQRESRESEVTRLRNELAAAREENARLRERADMTAQPNSCVADNSSSGEVRRRHRASSGALRTHHADRTRASQQIALASTAPVYTPPPAPPETPPPSSPPAHGMIITPLPSPPSASVEAGRRGGRAR
ncbi:MAG TPA: hypothetical protein VN903_19885 [Polyangia bacterium]|nr:hypothetical protein [Polyangia bacterium]